MSEEARGKLFWKNLLLLLCFQSARVIKLVTSKPKAKHIYTRVTTRGCTCGSIVSWQSPITCRPISRGRFSASCICRLWLDTKRQSLPDIHYRTSPLNDNPSRTIATRQLLPDNRYPTIATGQLLPDNRYPSVMGSDCRAGKKEVSLLRIQTYSASSSSSLESPSWYSSMMNRWWCSAMNVSKSFPRYFFSSPLSMAARIEAIFVLSRTSWDSR